MHHFLQGGNKSDFPFASMYICSYFSIKKIGLDIHVNCFLNRKISFDISCKLSPKEIICMEYQSLFSGTIKKNIVSLSFAELAHRLVKVNILYSTYCIYLYHQPAARL